MHEATDGIGPKFQARLVLYMLLSGLSVTGCGPEQAEKEDPGTPPEETLERAQQGLVVVNPGNGHTYHFLTTLKTWEQAQQSCAALGSYGVVVINNNAEEQWLQGYEGTARWWISYSDRIVEGGWRWYNGASTYNNWAPGEPNDGWSSEDCAVDNHSSTGAWNDVVCDGLYGYICESF